MSKLETLMNEYRENKRMIEELTAMNDELKASIIAEMHGLETVTAGSCKATCKSVATTRFDSKAFKADHPDVYAHYTKASAYTRFTVI